MAGHSLVYSPDHKAVLLIGGTGRGRMTIWAWRDRWQLVDGEGPPFRSLAAVSFMPGKGLIVHGGSCQDESGTWVHQGTTLLWAHGKWSVVAKDGPTPRDHHNMECMGET